MSSWTHIVACISVDTCMEVHRNELKAKVKQILMEAPQITGSEGNAEFFINIPRGHNTWIFRDCEHCVYGSTVKKEHHWDCDCPENYRCPDGKYQTQAIITVQGDLRNRTKDQTEAEFTAFLDYINTKFIIYDRSCSSRNRMKGIKGK